MPRTNCNKNLSLFSRVKFDILPHNVFYPRCRTEFISTSKKAKEKVRAFKRIQTLNGEKYEL